MSGAIPRITDAHTRMAGGAAGIRNIPFRGPVEKAKWLDSAASLDMASKYVRDFAKRFQNVQPAEARAREIQRWVRDHIRYSPDYSLLKGEPAEEFADSGIVLRRGFDDCDGKARLFVCLCRLCGIEARIRPVFRKHPIDFVHVQAECRYPGSHSDPRSKEGGWILCELILAGAEIGDNPDDLPRDAAGNRIIA